MDNFLVQLLVSIGASAVFIGSLVLCDLAENKLDGDDK